ncbi:MAG TPA: hypothetical protein VJP78_12965 [Thermoleophilia bacterium]|nr:hypothetical protein [Thermoleophilia bacterium]
MMASKYDAYVIDKAIRHDKWTSYDYYGDEDYKSDVTFFLLKVEEPCVMEEYPHAHDFDMYLHFMSFDPDHMDVLDADIEIGLGPEQEIHEINSPSSVFIPKGMIHCPLVFKRVGKPIFFIHTSIAPKYLKLGEGDS